MAELLRVEPRQGPSRCPLCRADLDGQAVTCDGCGAAYHAACGAELRGCPTLGCRRRTPTRAVPRPGPPAPWSLPEPAPPRAVRRAALAAAAVGLGLALSWAVARATVDIDPHRHIVSAGRERARALLAQGRWAEAARALEQIPREHLRHAPTREQLDVDDQAQWSRWAAWAVPAWEAGIPAAERLPPAVRLRALDELPLSMRQFEGVLGPHPTFRRLDEAYRAARERCVAELQAQASRPSSE